MITVDPGAPDLQPPLSGPALTRFVLRAAVAIGLSGTVSVLLTTDAELQRLNRTFRRKNKPTDVLSFPAAPIPGLPCQHQHAGDLAISLNIASLQAARFGHPLVTELRILILHGLLHLSGLDHETDRGQMATRESELRTQLRLPTALISRTEVPANRNLDAPSPRPPRQSRKPANSAPPRQTRSPRASLEVAPAKRSRRARPIATASKTRGPA